MEKLNLSTKQRWTFIHKSITSLVIHHGTIDKSFHPMVKQGLITNTCLPMAKHLTLAACVWKNKYVWGFQTENAFFFRPPRYWVGECIFAFNQTTLLFFKKPARTACVYMLIRNVAFHTERTRCLLHVFVALVPT